jgi:hypothetical protein
MIRFLSLPLLALGLATAAAAADDPREQAPAGLVITYTTTPQHRPALRAAMAHEVKARLAGLRRAGILAHYRLLWGRYADQPGGDAMLVLDLAPGAGTRGWAKVEQATPAALGPASLRLVEHVETAPIDVMRSARAADPATPTYLLVPYEYLVPVNDYLKYTEGYVVPQLDGWLRERALQGYDLLLARYPAGRPWNAMLLLQYRGDTGLARRDGVTARVRAQLASDPAWKALADSKQTIRSERIATIADVIAEE